MFLPFRRATFLIPSGPDEDLSRKHLFVVLTDPLTRAGKKISEVLLVSFSSLRIHHDPSCILKPGDHPFFRHESFADYSRARIEEAAKLSHFQQREPVAEEVFKRICQGLESSPHTAPKILAFYKEASGL